MTARNGATGMNLLIPLAVLGGLLLVPFGVPSFYLNVFILIFYFASLGSAWNIIGGMGGQLSLGHAAFVGVGAYTSSILFVSHGVSPWLGMILGAVLSAGLGAFIGFLCFRLRGPYFTLATIALAEILLLFCNYFRGLTKGAMGISIPFKPGFENMIFQGVASYYYLLLAYLVVCFLVSWKISHSRLGSYLVAIKESEDAAESLGVDSFRTKMKAMLVSASLTSVAGTLYAQYIKYIDPGTTFDITTSVNMALVAMIGGKGTVAGPAIGAALIIPINEVLRFWLGGKFEGVSYIVYAVIVIAVAVLMPEGIIAGVRKRFGRKPEALAAARLGGGAP